MCDGPGADLRYLKGSAVPERQAGPFHVTAITVCLYRNKSRGVLVASSVRQAGQSSCLVSTDYPFRVSEV